MTHVGKDDEGRVSVRNDVGNGRHFSKIWEETKRRNLRKCELASLSFDRIRRSLG